MQTSNRVRIGRKIKTKLMNIDELKSKRDRLLNWINFTQFFTDISGWQRTIQNAGLLLIDSIQK